MNIKILYEKKYIAEQHPYLLALVICIGVWAFTLCDQELFSGTAIIILSFFAIVQLFKKFIAGKKAQYLRFTFSSLGAIAVGILFFLSPYKGSILFLSGIVFLLFLYLKYKKELLHSENLRLAIISLAFLLYISYILFTTYEHRQIDAGYLHNGWGHLSYIEYLYNHWFVLPDADPREFFTQSYHPPLFYYLAAAVVRITSFLGIPYDTAIESVQIVSLYSAICTLITADKIFRKFNLKDYALTTALALTAFANSIVVLSGIFNNDMLSIALETGAVYCTLKWYDEKTLKNIVKIALCLGLGVMTKLSVILAAPPIAFIFIYTFFKEIKQYKKYLLQFSIFLLICVPLALWFPIKNLVIFGIPLGYVPEGNYSEYMESIPLWQRLFDFSLDNFKYPITVNHGASIFDMTGGGFEDYNPIIALIKSNVDMQMMREATSLASVFYLQFYLILFLGITGFVYMIYSLFRKNIKHIFMNIFYFTIMISYYIFCIKYPNIYAEHIRYVFDIIIIGSLYIGSLLQDKSNSKFMKYFKSIVYIAVIFYTMLSTIMWTALSFKK